MNKKTCKIKFCNDLEEKWKFMRDQSYLNSFSSLLQFKLHKMKLVKVPCQEPAWVFSFSFTLSGKTIYWFCCFSSLYLNASINQLCHFEHTPVVPRMKSIWLSNDVGSVHVNKGVSFDLLLPGLGPNILPRLKTNFSFVSLIKSLWFWYKG